MAKKNKLNVKHDYLLYLGIVLVVVVIAALFLFSDAWESGDVAGQATRKTFPPAYDATKCYDSDGGANKDIKGKITGPLLVQGSPTEDMCVDNKVREMVCKNGKGTSQLIDCNKYNALCQDGACISFCQDSDGGLKFDVKGQISGAMESPNGLKEDTCKDSYTLNEVYCNKNKKGVSLIHKCASNEECNTSRCNIVLPEEKWINLIDENTCINDVFTSKQQSTLTGEIIITTYKCSEQKHWLTGEKYACGFDLAGKVFCVPPKCVSGETAYFCNTLNGDYTFRKYTCNNGDWDINFEPYENVNVCPKGVNCFDPNNQCS